MAKKQSIVSDISSALEAVAARAEKLVTSKAAKKTTSSSAASKPVAKRTTAAKHSKTTSAKVESKPEPKATPVVAAAPVTVPVVISHEEVAKLAYSYWEARGYQPGDPAEDWARAEAELKQRFSL